MPKVIHEPKKTGKKIKMVYNNFWTEFALMNTPSLTNQRFSDRYALSSEMAYRYDFLSCQKKVLDQLETDETVLDRLNQFIGLRDQNTDRALSEAGLVEHVRHALLRRFSELIHHDLGTKKLYFPSYRINSAVVRFGLCASSKKDDPKLAGQLAVMDDYKFGVILKIVREQILHEIREVCVQIG